MYQPPRSDDYYAAVAKLFVILLLVQVNGQRKVKMCFIIDASSPWRELLTISVLCRFFQITKVCKTFPLHYRIHMWRMNWCPVHFLGAMSMEPTISPDRSTNIFPRWESFVSSCSSFGRSSNILIYIWTVLVLWVLLGTRFHVYSGWPNQDCTHDFKHQWGRRGTWYFFFNTVYSQLWRRNCRILSWRWEFVNLLWNSWCTRNQSIATHSIRTVLVLPLIYDRIGVRCIWIH